MVLNNFPWLDNVVEVFSRDGFHNMPEGGDPCLGQRIKDFDNDCFRVVFTFLFRPIGGGSSGLIYGFKNGIAVDGAHGVLVSGGEGKGMEIM